MAIIPPAQIVQASGPRQVIPYGDRPMGQIINGQVYATQDFYQWISRLSQGYGNTVENVGTLVSATNQLSDNVTEVVDEVTTVQEDITTLEREIINQIIPVPPPPPQSPPPPLPNVAGPLYPPPRPVPPVPPPAAPAAPPGQAVPPLHPDPPAGLPFAVSFGLAFFFRAA
jgi:hypothetical protein